MSIIFCNNNKGNLPIIPKQKKRDLYGYGVYWGIAYHYSKQDKIIAAATRRFDLLY